MTSRSARTGVLSGTVLGIGLGLTSATQLRPVEGLPVGPGEVLLAGWVMASVAELFVRGAVYPARGAKVLTLFWGAAFCLLSIGWVVGLTLGASQPAVVRDILAFGLSAAIFLSCLAHPNGGRRVVAAQGALVWTVVLPSSLFLLLTTVGVLSVGPIRYWYFDIRFEGWAQNPNQYALAVLAIPIWSFGRLGAVPRPALKVLAGVLAVLTGMLSRSDALWLAWGTALLCFAGYQAIRVFLRGQTSRVWTTAALLALAMSVLLLLVFTGGRLWTFGLTQATNTFEANAQGSDRLHRWHHAIEVMGDSPLVGMGPGSFSGPSRPYEGEEAHNTLLDWGASTGLLGILLMVALVLYVAAQVLRRRDGVAGLLLVALIVFSSFHYVARQPIAWLILLGALFAPARASGFVREADK